MYVPFYEDTSNIPILHFGKLQKISEEVYSSNNFIGVKFKKIK